MSYIEKAADPLLWAISVSQKRGKIIFADTNFKKKEIDKTKTYLRYIKEKENKS